MKYSFIVFSFLLSIVLLSVFINLQCNKEPFTHSIALLGDSIFRNDAYVSSGQSVCDRLRGKVNCLAKDHATIADVYSQIEKLTAVPSVLFLSVGGNDILMHYVYTNNGVGDLSFVAESFEKYRELTRQVERATNQLVLVDLYFPTGDAYSSYAPIIREWNRRVYEWAEKNKWEVLKVSRLLTQPDDFAYGIEPSSKGAEKLADAICAYSTTAIGE